MRSTQCIKLKIKLKLFVNGFARPEVETRPLTCLFKNVSHFCCWLQTLLSYDVAREALAFILKTNVQLTEKGASLNNLN